MSKIKFEMKQVRKGRPKLTEEERLKRKQKLTEALKEKRRLRRLAEEEERKKYLPCPFCGSKNINWQWTIPEWCQCEDCGATGPQGSGEQTKEEAIKSWNKRAKFSS